MTRRKDPQPEAAGSQDAPPPAETVAVEPFVVSEAVDLPPQPASTPPTDDPERPPQVIVRRGSALAPLLGGALAAIGGFALSHFNVLDMRAPDSAADLTALASQVSDIQTRIPGLEALVGDVAALSTQVSQLEAVPAPPSTDLSRLDRLEERLAAIETMPTEGAASSAAISAKLAELDRRLATLPQTASPELQQQLDAALARLDEAEAAASARAEEATNATAAAERTQALDALAAKLSEGVPFATELQAVDDPPLVQVLGPLAESGIPSLAGLQASFPDAAREAFRIVRDTSVGDGWGDRFLGFLASQTGARPLTPLEGDTPDAILSRADFALSEGRVADALAELQPLDPAIKTALDPWLAQAQAHVAATAALAAARGE